MNKLWFLKYAWYLNEIWTEFVRQIVVIKSEKNHNERAHQDDNVYDKLIGKDLPKNALCKVGSKVITFIIDENNEYLPVNNASQLCVVRFVI